MILGLACILHPMISSSLSHFSLSSCLLSAFPLLCLASVILFLLFPHVMSEWARFPLHWRHFTPAGYLEGPVFIPVYTTCGGHTYTTWLSQALFACSRMCILTLPFDCSTEKCHQLVVDMTISRRVLLCLSNYLQLWLGNLGGIGWLLPIPLSLAVKDHSLGKACHSI